MKIKKSMVHLIAMSTWHDCYLNGCQYFAAYHVMGLIRFSGRVQGDEGIVRIGPIGVVRGLMSCFNTFYGGDGEIVVSGLGLGLLF